MKVPEREQKENGDKAVCEEVMADNFPELMKGMTLQILGA